MVLLDDVMMVMGIGLGWHWDESSALQMNMTWSADLELVVQRAVSK